MQLEEFKTNGKTIHTAVIKDQSTIKMVYVNYISTSALLQCLFSDRVGAYHHAWYLHS